MRSMHDRFPDHAVLHRRQGDQPRGHPPHPAEDGGPLRRASVHGDRPHQPRLRRSAVADGEIGAAPRPAWSGKRWRWTATPRTLSSSRSPRSSRSSAENWKARVSPKSGNPVYERPVVLVLYRNDHHFLLDQIIPKPGGTVADYDLVIASQPYRARCIARVQGQARAGAARTRARSRWPHDRDPFLRPRSGHGDHSQGVAER